MPYVSILIANLVEIANELEIVRELTESFGRKVGIEIRDGREVYFR